MKDGYYSGCWVQSSGFWVQRLTVRNIVEKYAEVKKIRSYLSIDFLRSKSLCDLPSAPRIPDTGTLTLSANPVLDLQTRYEFKFPFVVGHYDKAFRLGVRGDPQIIVSDRPPFGLQ